MAVFPEREQERQAYTDLKESYDMMTEVAKQDEELLKVSYLLK